MISEAFSLGKTPASKPAKSAPKDPRNQQAVGILFFAILPLAFSMLGDPSAANLAICGGLLAVFGISLFGISLGLKGAERYNSQDIARKARFPGRILGSVGMGIGCALTAGLRGSDLGQIAVLAVIATVLSLLAFGIDPLKDKGLETVKDRQVYKTSKLRRRAEAQVAVIGKVVKPLGDAELLPDLRRFEDAVQRMLQAVEDDPERARSLQKYLGVYLDGAAEAATRFVAVYRSTGDVDAHARFGTLIRDLGGAFDRKATEYAAQGRDKMNVQIDVLSESLAREAARG
ncbi:5-bromo-4-chloroindolyl phosphate hydrolysis family protein [uncultured Tateyamaria sp.]|uniref:5-bromo-4-chloroindolyl phosphate hydrolysis family protein n=1 Tax=uncultured Tateyamaria sp. TaxID=455651 RepID=UPI00261433FC|nr:5-bromo-4-chloroindolyl phosphate hydrolysis family protein [uncultured Tateyamaria sp.]